MDLHIKDVLKKYIKEEPIGETYYNQKIKSYWEESMNATISSRTTGIYLKGGELTITVNSGPLRHELFLSRMSLLDQINEHLGQRVIQRITLR